jgi:hypothetical protein
MRGVDGGRGLYQQIHNGFLNFEKNFLKNISVILGHVKNTLYIWGGGWAWLSISIYMDF